MQTTLIPLDRLHVSPLNMRADKKEPSLKRMAEIAANILPTVREKGVLTPLIVRPNNDGFEILAGRRRFYAARVIAHERSAFEPLACDIRDVDDATALEISTVENVAREDVSEIALYEAYDKLIRQGRSVGEIARLFDKDEREVKGCLAIANLLPPIRALYAQEELDTDDLRLLTMATPTQQRAWLKLWKQEDAPLGDGLKQWLFGGAAVRADHALFDLEPFQEKIVGDLFSDERYFTDPNIFWAAQDEAIATRRDAYLAAKWSDVVVLERGRPLYAYEMVKMGKKDGGRVYVQPTHTGEVRFLEGYITRKEAQAREAEERKSTAKRGKEAAAESSVPARAPITNMMRNYLDLHRHAVARLALLASPADALRLLLAHAIASSGNWSVRADAQRADGKAIAGSLASSRAQTTFAAEARKIRALLAPAFRDAGEDDADTAPRVTRHGNDDELTVRVFQRLLKLKDADVARIAACVMAETLAAGSAVTDAFGQHAKIATAEHWQPDAAFFELLRDRASVNKMLAEVAGKKNADSQVSARLKDQKSALAAAAAKMPDWCPGWMRFPAKD